MRPIFKLYATTIYIQNMPKTLRVFTLWSIQASNHIVAPPSLPHPKSAMHHPSAVQHSFWLNPDGARSKSIPSRLHLHCHDSSTFIIFQPWTPQSSGVGAFSIWGLRCCCFLYQLCCCCCCVCYTYIFAIWTSPSIHTLISCRDVPTSTTSGNFCYKVIPDRAGIVHFQFPAIHRSTFVTFLLNMTFNSEMKTPSQPLDKTVVTAEISLWFCWLQ